MTEVGVDTFSGRGKVDRLSDGIKVYPFTYEGKGL